MESNEVLDKLPSHLMSLVIDQPYNDYTAQDHAIWRYVMQQNVRYLGKVAHHSYLDGLKKTGISIDHIPHMYGMNRILKEIGWAAVAVDGFIPPAAFMEFQAYHVLVIAADIRPIDQVEYTPAPDIIHEAAGHAPIIADPDYSRYLARFGELGCKAFSSARDYQLYEAIRHLSIVKADPYSTETDIRKAFQNLQQIEQDMGAPSEMARVRNLHWWTVEYGLIGDLKNPKIYGAGLLSSIGESYSALNNGATHLPYTLEAMNTGFDITSRQPQLFVTPDFDHLNAVLEAFADTMALRRGGLYGVRQAVDSANTGTCVWSSGLQISGTFTAVKEKQGEPVYLQAGGPVTLSAGGRVLPGHGKAYHTDGFGSPVGRIRGITAPLETLSDGELEHHGILPGKEVRLQFESGVTVSGTLSHTTRHEGKLLLLSFTGCTVRLGEDVLFRPEWGTYDMAVGEKIISAFSGPADPDAFGLNYPVPVEKTHKIAHSPETKALHSLYQAVRDLREGRETPHNPAEIWGQVDQSSGEWLLPLEILEHLRAEQSNPGLQSEVRAYLLRLKIERPGLERLIGNGMEEISG